MTAKEINQSIESMKVNLTTTEKIEHWINFFFILFLLSFIGIITIYDPLSNGEIPTYGVFVILVLFLFIRHNLLSSKLVVCKITLSGNQFKQANQAAAKLCGWAILSNKQNYFSAIKETGWQWEGIKITAILKNGKLYLNSMVNPSIRSNPFTFGLNKKNKVELIRQYQLILKGEDVVTIANKEIEKREKEYWKESEWTFGKFLTRIIMYCFFSVFFIFGIWMIFTGELKTIGIGIFLVGLASLYIYFDIQLILKKRKNQAITRSDHP